jgi:hypothetical protein
LGRGGRTAHSLPGLSQPRLGAESENPGYQSLPVQTKTKKKPNFSLYLGRGGWVTKQLRLLLLHRRRRSLSLYPPLSSASQPSALNSGPSSSNSLTLYHLNLPPLQTQSPRLSQLFLASASYQTSWFK